MALICDKYKPISLSKLDYNLDQAKHIRRMIQSNDFPHLLVYGIPGAGKKTRVHCFLKEIFGSAVDKLKLESRTYTNPSNKKIEINVISSSFHCEVNPSDVGVNDRVIVQELVKDMASSTSLSEKHRFKVVVITEADKLTIDAQHGLRRTMEKYINALRIILIGNSSSRIIPAIRSRCFLVRVAAPTEEKITEILLNVAKKESISLSDETARKAARASERNLRRALLMLDTMKTSHNTNIVLPVWKAQIKKIADQILKQQNVTKLAELRASFYELQVHLIPPEVVFTNLVSDLMPNCDSKIKSQLIELASHYEHLMKTGSKKIFYFEAFTANFMNIYRQQFDSLNFDDLICI